mmetsp:Transcript_53441/g.130087  ORF Transcript_53441/g.130087 Transcript_53441/m.130087 type:complete len:177 (-) Transcript_53441:3537-4067(-)
MPIPGGTIINIAGTSPVDDPEYRYKMPAVYGKVEGSGNGIKTAIPNISDVAMSLRRSPGEVNKFFGCELGAQTTYSDETDRAIVNGSHTDDALQKLVHRYVEGFVLCPKCGLVSGSLICMGGVSVTYLFLEERTPFSLLSLLSFLKFLNSQKRSTKSRTEQSGTNVQPAVPRRWWI